jgi:hypothetical protein
VFTTYLSRDSELEVNLGQNLQGVITSKIESGDISHKMFDGVLKGVEENLRDTYGRFCGTKIFQNYIDSQIFLESQAQ